MWWQCQWLRYLGKTAQIWPHLNPRKLWMLPSMTDVALQMWLVKGVGKRRSSWHIWVGPNVIVSILIGGRKERPDHRRRPHDQRSRREIWRCYVAGFKDRGEGVELSNAKTAFLEGGKAMKWVLTWSFQRELSLPRTWSQLSEPILDFWLQNWERISVSCSKPLSLWSLKQQP